jgi:hypothetical protein
MQQAHGGTPGRTAIFAKHEDDAQVPVCVATAKTPESAMVAAVPGGTLQAPPHIESNVMKIVRSLIAAALFAIALPAAARTACEELQAEIDAKIKANGVPVYTLSIIDAANEAGAEGKIVGSCDGGTKRIVYLRGAAAAAEPAVATQEAATTE